MLCLACQAPITPDNRFCPQCGQPMPSVDPEKVIERAAVMRGSLDVEGLTRLRAEEKRLSADLREIMRRGAGRDLTPHERKIWDAVHSRWSSVSSDITARMQQISARRAHDRRSIQQRQSERRKQHITIEIPERRTGGDRRTTERRRTDRRAPFPERS